MRGQDPAPVLRAARQARASGGGVVNAKLAIHPGGFGFAERLDGHGSVFVPPGNLGGAMDTDEVVVAWWPAERGAEGQVRSILKRGRTRMTGVLHRGGGRFYVEPDDPRILHRASVLGAPPSDARVGMVVLCKIVDYPDLFDRPMCVEVERGLGTPGSLETEEFKILLDHGIDPLFPPAVLEDAQNVPDKVEAGDRENRDDLRTLPFMTIDPKDARDFDDAVCVELDEDDPEGGTMRLHVAVADVSHYVRPGTIVDAEAARRQFSTYLPDRAIPMLPETLSSGICSLVAGVDRCAMVVTIDVDGAGRAGEPWVRAALIRSRKRLTYDEVAAELAGAHRLPPRVRAKLTDLRRVADRLRQRRLKRGAVELELPETRIELDEDDPQRIRRVYSTRSDPQIVRAYNLIEELMLAANEAVARVAVKHQLPVIFRIHDKPEANRVARFTAIASLFGLSVDPEQLQSSRGMQRFIARIGEHPRRGALHALLLRTLAQAEYETANAGHFALASPAYLHFTSPIRRYPDLVTHRVIKAWLATRGGKAGPAPVPPMPKGRDTHAQAVHGSERERASQVAERDAKSLFAAAFMRERIGDRIEGMVTGFSTSGMFVALDDPFVDGMVRRASLEREHRDHYEMDDLGVRLTATRSGHTFAVGDRVMVEIIDASIVRRQIELALVSKLS